VCGALFALNDGFSAERIKNGYGAPDNKKTKESGTKG
jgi:hypothetical protein